MVKWTVLHCRFIVKRQQIEMASEGEEHATKQVPYLLDQCLNVICEIVDLVEEVARRGLLVVMQDTGSCMTSTMVVFLKKVSAVRVEVLHQGSLMETRCRPSPR